MQVRLSKHPQIHVLCGEDIYKVMQQILLRENKIRRNQEHFWVVGLDNKNKILFIELVSLGAVNRFTVAPPEVFRMGIYKLAVKAVLVHNHPSGVLEPSKNDHNMTDRMLKAGKIINIEVIDHLIISEQNYFSFNDAGIMDELANNGLWEVIPRERVELEKMKHEAELKRICRQALLEGKEKGRKEGLKEGEQRGVEQGVERGKAEGLKEGKLEIAKNLLNLDIDIDSIQKATGLSTAQIEALSTTDPSI